MLSDSLTCVSSVVIMSLISLGLQEFAWLVNPPTKLAPFRPPFSGKSRHAHPLFRSSAVWQRVDKAPFMADI